MTGEFGLFVTIAFAERWLTLDTTSVMIYSTTASPIMSAVDVVRSLKDQLDTAIKTQPVVCGTHFHLCCTRWIPPSSAFQAWGKLPVHSQRGHGTSTVQQATEY
jgi:hypothetical protein